MTRMILALCLLVAANPAWAQNTEWRFRWQKGQVLPYAVDHATTVKEIVAGKQIEATSHLRLVKRWQVTAVDDQGVATLQLAVQSLRHEQKRPNGETLLFDSQNPDQSTPELHEQMQKYLGTTLAEIRVDGQGRVLESLKGPATKYDSEPPFVVLLPGKTPTTGQGWKRNYHVTLEPPHGAGEKHNASQTYQCTKLENGQATIRFITEFAALPENVDERMPLLQRMPEGTVVFDIESGKLLRAQVRTDRAVPNHRGENSSYQFISTYDERYVGQ